MTDANKLTFDPSLLELFRAEIDIHLPALSEGLLALEKDPGEAQQLGALMRTAGSTPTILAAPLMEWAARISASSRSDAPGSFSKASSPSLSAGR